MKLLKMYLENKYKHCQCQNCLEIFVLLIAINQNQNLVKYLKRSSLHFNFYDWKKKWCFQTGPMNNSRGKRNLVLSAWGDESLLSEECINLNYVPSTYESYSEQTRNNLVNSFTQCLYIFFVSPIALALILMILWNLHDLSRKDWMKMSLTMISLKTWCAILMKTTLRVRYSFLCL